MWQLFLKCQLAKPRSHLSFIVYLKEKLFTAWCKNGVSKRKHRLKIQKRCKKELKMKNDGVHKEETREGEKGMGGGGQDKREAANTVWKNKDKVFKPGEE